MSDLPVLQAASSPHLATARTTRGAMVDVLIALLPVLAAAIWLFGSAALLQVGLAVAACLGGEVIFTRMRGRRATLGDGSAAVTGVILGLSLPWSAPWYVAVIGGLAAIGLGKVVYGGLGQNLFNPAMVGRAFVMIAFSQALGGGAFVDPESMNAIITQATPLSLAKASGETGVSSLSLLLGTHNGCLGESSIVACLLGAAWLLLRRTADWRIPVGILVTVAVLGAFGNLAGEELLARLPVLGVPVADQMLSGALVFGAVYIATDPVSSPLTKRGLWIYAIGIGALVWLLRMFSGYPEGLMFAVLMMNGLTPLLNRWTVPTPVGGPLPAQRA